MAFVVKRMDDQWAVVEEVGVNDRIVKKYYNERRAMKHMQELNSQSAQAALGSFGMYSVVSYGNKDVAPEECTCQKGMLVEAVSCPVHSG